MSRELKNERHAERPPMVNAFDEATLGTIDPSGYTAGDVRWDAMAPVPLGGQVVGGGALGEAGASSTTSGLGMSDLGGLWVGPQHAQRPAPLEYTADVARPHAGPRANEYGETY